MDRRPPLRMKVFAERRKLRDAEMVADANIQRDRDEADRERWLKQHANKGNPRKGSW